MSDSTQTGGSGARAAVAANLICLVSMVTWAFGFPSAERLLESWDVLFLSTSRILVAVAVLLPIWIAVDGFGALARARWRRGMMVGGIGFGAGLYLMLLGQKLSDPVTVSIVAATMPAVGGVLEVVLDGRRRGMKFVAGIVLAIAGAVIATGLGGGEGNVRAGAALALGSVTTYAWASRASVVDFPEMSKFGQTTMTLAGAGLFTGLITLGVWATTDYVPISAPVDRGQLADLAIFGIAAGALSQLLWLVGVGRLGVAIASLHVNAAPFYVMLLVIMAGGAWQPHQAVGAALVGLGIFIAQVPRRR